MNKDFLTLYFVAGSQDCIHLPNNPADNLLNILEQALKAGITCFQFRDKGRNSLANHPKKQKQLAIQCQNLCRQYHIPFIVNDNVGLALEIEADGIHVGQTDTPVQQIKKQSSHKILVGLSVNTFTQAKQAEEIQELDYIGIGPIFPTQSKEDPKPVVGINFIPQLRQAGISKPIVAIGGIKEDSVSILKQNGADGIAVISAITKAQNIDAAVKKLLCK